MDNKENNNEEYTVKELLDRLAEDESWEKNPQVRKSVAENLKSRFKNC